MGFVRFNRGGIRCHRPQPSICFSCWRFLSPSPAAEMNVWLHLRYRNWQDVLQPPGRRDLLCLTRRIVSQNHSGMAVWVRSGCRGPWQKRGARAASPAACWGEGPAPGSSTSGNTRRPGHEDPVGDGLFGPLKY